MNRFIVDHIDSLLLEFIFKDIPHIPYRAFFINPVIIALGVWHIGFAAVGMVDDDERIT